MPWTTQKVASIKDNTIHILHHSGGPVTASPALNRCQSCELPFSQLPDLTAEDPLLVAPQGFEAAFKAVKSAADSVDRAVINLVEPQAEADSKYAEMEHNNFEMNGALKSDLDMGMILKMLERENFTEEEREEMLAELESGDILKTEEGEEEEGIVALQDAKNQVAHARDEIALAHAKFNPLRAAKQVREFKLTPAPGSPRLQLQCKQCQKLFCRNCVRSWVPKYRGHCGGCVAVWRATLKNKKT
jgi:hypothetical protein